MLRQNWQRDRRWWDDYKTHAAGYPRQSLPIPGWLKRAVAAVILFIVCYAAYGYDTPITTPINNTVNYTLNHQTDWAYWWQKTQEFRAQQMDSAVFKQMAPVLIRPVDPLQYMTTPVPGKVSGSFGWHDYPSGKGQFFRDGLEFETEVGAAVKCAAPGTVKSISASTQYTNVLIIDHGTDTETVYGYVGDVLVQPGERVSQGQVVARVGKGEKVKGGRLFFAVRQKGEPVDPALRLQQPVGP